MAWIKEWRSSSASLLADSTSLVSLCTSACCTFLSVHLQRGGIRRSCSCWLAKVIFTSRDWGAKPALGCWTPEEASPVPPPRLEGPLLSVPSSPWFRLQKGQNSGTLVLEESCKFMVGCCGSPQNTVSPAVWWWKWWRDTGMRSAVWFGEDICITESLSEGTTCNNTQKSGRRNCNRLADYSAPVETPVHPRNNRCHPHRHKQPRFSVSSDCIPAFHPCNLIGKLISLWHSGRGSLHHRSGALAQHLPAFVSRHIMQTPPFSHPGICRFPSPRCDQDFFGMCRGIAARSGRGCDGVPAELLEWKCSGSALAELSTGSIYLPHVCGLRDDVMRNLLTCASLLQIFFFFKCSALEPKCGICENKQIYRAN